MHFSSFSALRDSGFFLVSAHIRLNDTSLKFVSCLGDETHTDFDYKKYIFRSFTCSYESSVDMY